MAALFLLELASLPQPPTSMHCLRDLLALGSRAHAALMSATAGFAGAVQSYVFVMRHG
jgi:hypothetical protein